MIRFCCVVIGYGSIGQRHARILSELGHHVAVVSKRNIKHPHLYHNIDKALQKENPDYIVIANETHKHEDTLAELERNGYNNKILVEKPLFSFANERNFNFSNLFVGYNLRQHPLIKMLYEKIKNKEVIAVQAYVGQYLPHWRPGMDYTKSYSAKLDFGGGVIRDLSHELDFLQFLFGEWNSLVALGGKFSNLSIDSDDNYAIIYKTKRVPLISLQMNYLDHITQRFVIINTLDETYKADFITNTLQVNDKIYNFDVERDTTYILQHASILNNQTEFLCTFEAGMKTTKMIEAAEKSSMEKVWITNE
ncbi:Gfo/Idh/MocA family protein [Lederbergia wuyishanensis]|uniref:Dehydrogenase n=1 Tax=Lederbergia wuyishanensis TaxID=1347903 RepID=A0ABU0D8R4_9BACI|nr:Gfo/Idh/MocA family oxidoreductase [Lederbergia wuyishanensis]MCJ8007610.1 Gfo/Idh/MocA family oxidoreductase [Lederbergia wuyishanensis]MDQ0344806.1 putative dehydrogenase [Lederbergia wuyishanensis]